LSFRISHFEND